MSEQKYTIGSVNELSRIIHEYYKQRFIKAVKDIQHDDTAIKKIRLAHIPVLLLLANSGNTPSRLTSIALTHDITQQATGKKTKELQKHGVLNRVMDPTDKRAKLYSISDLGFKTIDKLNAIDSELFATYFAGNNEDIHQDIITDLCEAQLKFIKAAGLDLNDTPVVEDSQ